MTDRRNLRDKIAWALFDQDYSGANRRASGAAWLLIRDRTDEDSTWHRAADAVLAVIDVDAVRAEAQVEALRNAQRHIEGMGVEPWNALTPAVRHLAFETDRIAREAGIETGEEAGA